jgi:hypothetical protein
MIARVQFLEREKKKKETGRVHQRALHQDELIGSKQPVVK